jgi:HlyD family secretion protein
VKRRIIWLVLILAAAGLITGGYLYSQGIGSRPPYRTAAVTRGPLTAAISSTGTLNAVITVQVGSQVSGQIKELYADFNSQVKKNQIIARIDPDPFEAKVNQAKAQVDAARASVLNQRAVVEKTRADLENARAGQAVAKAQTAKSMVGVVDGRRNLQRQRDLRQRNLVAQADEDAAQVAHDSAVAQYDATVAQERAQVSAVRSAEAQLKVTQAMLQNADAQVGQFVAALRQAQLDLNHSIIRAPVDGVVVSRTVDVGQTVAASLQAPTLFTIAQDLTKMQVDTNVDEADVGRVQVSQRASFTVDSFPGRTFRGEVVQIRKAPQVLQNVVTYDVVVSAQNNELKLLPGMTANVRIVTDQKDSVLKVPNSALRFRPPGVEDRPGPRPAGPGAGTGAGTGAGPSAGSAGGPRSGGLAGRVWIVDPGGKPQPLQVQLGVSDGTSTELLGGLKEGQDVIVGLSVPGDRPGQPAQPSQPGAGPRLRL